MNDVKYIALDFDGTILNSDGEMSKNLEEKLINLQKNGYKVVLCSGRSLKGIEWVAKKIDLSKYSGYIIAYNGSQIYEYNNGDLVQLHDIKFESQEVEDIADLVANKVQSFATYCENKMSTTNYIDRLNRSSKSMGLDLDYDYIKDTPKIVLFDTEEGVKKIFSEVEDLIRKYNNNINVFSSVSSLIEITPPLSTKGEALKVLSELKNLKADEFICFGDNGNDISMFEFCKYSVAMENSIDEIKAICTHKTKTNNEDGVYIFLNNNF